MNRQYTFSKKERLSHRKQIDKLFSEGRSFTLHPFKVFYAIHENAGEYPVQILIAIPKKEYKKAVDRNRLRRLIREAYRLNKHALVEHLSQIKLNIHIGFVYLGNSAIPPFAEIEEKLTSCLQKLIRIFTPKIVEN